MNATANLYETQKAREITHLTQSDDIARYVQCAVLPVIILMLLIVLMRRAA